MPEVWLRTNIRPYLPAAALCALLVIAGGLTAADAVGGGWPVWLRTLGAVVAGVGLIALCALAWIIRRPRLAYQDGNLLVQVHHGRRDRVPLAAVECFLLGRGPAYLSRHRDLDGQVATVIVRLSPKQQEFAYRDVDPRLGAWCDSHITLRGTWCEPIDLSVVRRLNQRLAEAQRAVQQSEAECNLKSR
jgi:hypothetical protein